MINYQKGVTELCFIMSKNGSDKGLANHNYTEIYYELFKNKRHDCINLFEMGIGSTNPTMPCNMTHMKERATPGASLRGWKEFFPNGNIVGADIDKDVLFSEERINTYYCNQLVKEDIENLLKNNNIAYDIIIDDGFHNLQANLCLFENSISFLKENGIYIIEDIRKSELNNYKKAFEKFNNYNILYQEIEHEYNNYDNVLMIIKKI